MKTNAHVNKLKYLVIHFATQVSTK